MFCMFGNSQFIKIVVCTSLKSQDIYRLPIVAPVRFIAFLGFHISQFRGKDRTPQSLSNANKCRSKSWHWSLIPLIGIGINTAILISIDWHQPMTEGVLKRLTGCQRRPINSITWLVVLYLSYIWVKKEFVLYYFWKCPQGTKSSDLSLISDFFPTPRTILEISVNQKRIFFWRGGGRDVGVQWPKMALEGTICDPRRQKYSWGRTPRPPWKRLFHLAFIQETHVYTAEIGITVRLFGWNPFWSLSICL